MIRIFAFALCALVVSVPAAEACAAGCDKFKWPLEATLKRLKADDLPIAASGGTLDGDEVSGFVFALMDEEDVTFAVEPERRKEGDEPLYGGLIRFAPAKPGKYQITLSEEGWVDLVQNDKLVASTDYTGSADCDGVHKSVRFELDSEPVTLQISGASVDSMNIAIEAVK